MIGHFQPTKNNLSALGFLSNTINMGYAILVNSGGPLSQPVKTGGFFLDGKFLNPCNRFGRPALNGFLSKSAPGNSLIILLKSGMFDHGYYIHFTLFSAIGLPYKSICFLLCQEKLFHTFDEVCLPVVPGDINCFCDRYRQMWTVDENAVGRDLPRSIKAQSPQWPSL